MKTLLKTLLISIAAMSLAAKTNAGVSIDEFKHSVWQTQYLSLGGEEIQATTVLDGDSGYYNTQYGRGELSNIIYRFDEVGGQFKAQVSGRWRMEGMEGTFHFTSSNFLQRPQWNGEWSLNGQRRGYWRGEYSNPLATSPFPAQGMNSPASCRDFGPWSSIPGKTYFARRCSFPGGGYQYLIFYPENPNWVYWYNPTVKVFWCACPTINHPICGNAVQNGQEFFLMASSKGSTVENTQFSDPGINGANFKPSAQAKDQDGSIVNIDSVPDDLPI